MKSRVNNTRTLAKVYFIYYNNIISVKSVFALEQKQYYFRFSNPIVMSPSFAVNVKKKVVVKL